MSCFFVTYAPVVWTFHVKIHNSDASSTVPSTSVFQKTTFQTTFRILPPEYWLLDPLLLSWEPIFTTLNSLGGFLFAKNHFTTGHVRQKVYSISFSGSRIIISFTPNVPGMTLTLKNSTKFLNSLSKEGHDNVPKSNPDFSRLLKISRYAVSRSTKKYLLQTPSR